MFCAQWLGNPASAVSLMGTAVPQTASFFLTYMAVLAFLTVPLGGLRIVGLLLFWVKGKIAATERARARLWQDQFALYGADVSLHTRAHPPFLHLNPISLPSSWVEPSLCSWRVGVVSMQ